jgi:hypothetical protein
MVWRISVGDGPADPPDGPVLASVVRRRGGSARSWGARLACLTRRGSPLTSPFPATTTTATASAESGSGADPPGTAGVGPVSRDSSQGGLAARPGRGDATGVMGVADSAGAPGPGAVGPPAGPGGLRSVQPGKGAGWSAGDREPVPGNGAELLPGNGAELLPGNGEALLPVAGAGPLAGYGGEAM